MKGYNSSTAGPIFINLLFKLLWCYSLLLLAGDKLSWFSSIRPSCHEAYDHTGSRADYQPSLRGWRYKLGWRYAEGQRQGDNVIYRLAKITVIEALKECPHCVFVHSLITACIDCGNVVLTYDVNIWRLIFFDYLATFCDDDGRIAWIGVSVDMSRFSTTAYVVSRPIVVLGYYRGRLLVLLWK